MARIQENCRYDEEKSELLALCQSRSFIAMHILYLKLTDNALFPNTTLLTPRLAITYILKSIELLLDYEESCPMK